MNHQIRFTVEKIERRVTLLQSLVYRHKHPIDPFRYHELASAETPPPLDADSQDWTVIAPSSYWGHIQQNFVMRSRFSVPTDFTGTIALYLPMGDSGDFAHPEALIYVDGKALATVDRFHQEVFIPDVYRDGKSHDLFLHGWTGYWNSHGADGQLLMRQCYVVQIEQPLRDLAVLANTAVRVAKTLDDNNPAKYDILTAVDQAVLALDLREPFGDAFYASVSSAQQVFNDGLHTVGAPLDVTVMGAGHAHIDVAWLWTLGQTRRKAARTFYNVHHLMSQFPEYKFTQSQPQLYEYIRQDYPELFEIIKQRVREGRWETIGGMWIEADCNLSGAESLVRQFVLGRQFFAEHFGKNSDSPILWLPDVFGYSAQLPQLIRLAGMEYFFTIKIGWNQYNKLPYDSFWWQGLDGTKVLTHFSTTPENATGDYPSTYNAPANPESPTVTWKRFKQKEHERTLLMVYGWGDGGGGPTRDMLENISALAEFPASPRARFSTALEFFQQLERESGKKLPTWSGELYLEYHRGTYTTQARNKRANRKSEILLHDAEFLATYASILDKTYEYPHETFRTAWRLICLNQFHDIIPGSSIGEVYVESLQQYAEVERLGNEALEGALAVLKQHVSGEQLLVNSSPVSQTHENSDLVSAYSLVGVSASAPNDLQEIAITGGVVLENEAIRVEFNADGDITRITDLLVGREVLPKGAIANQFQAFEDRPMNWDAWDIDVFYQDKMWLASSATTLRLMRDNWQQTLTITRTLGMSTIIQRISLSNADERLLTFDTDVDWQETHTLLKVAFPVDVLSPKATYEVQWGHVERPTHWNTSWDWAKFETVGHKWVNLSEGGYSVSLLNDCKYGHDIRDNIIRLTLLKSATFPDPTADKGQHIFKYGLHLASSVAESMPMAYAFNDPLRTLTHTALDAPERLSSLVAVDETGTSVIVETIKRAEDNHGVIVRLYEPYRSRGWVTLHTAFDIQQAFITNLLEEPLETLVMDTGSRQVRFYVKPFQIVTVRLVEK